METRASTITSPPRVYRNRTWREAGRKKKGSLESKPAFIRRNDSFYLYRRRPVSRHSHKYHSLVRLDVAETITHRRNAATGFLINSQSLPRDTTLSRKFLAAPLDPSWSFLPGSMIFEARRKTIRPSGMKGSPWVTGEFVVQDWYSVIYDSSNLGYARYRDWKIYDAQLRVKYFFTSFVPFFSRANEMVVCFWSWKFSLLFF